MKKETLIDAFNKMPLKVKEIILTEKQYSLIEDITLMMDYMESPIELILYSAIVKIMDEIGLYLYVEPQTEIECKNGKKYRADFTIFYDEICNPLLKEDFLLDIECDGYEFHQKTKKQVKNDNQREYDLKMEGYEILRFSGTQIFENPERCAADILNYIIEKNKLTKKEG